MESRATTSAVTAERGESLFAETAENSTPQRIAGRLLTTAGALILTGIVTAEALYTAPYNTRMEISDLGATHTEFILHPSFFILNATMVVTGAMIVVGADRRGHGNHFPADTISGVFLLDWGPIARLDLGGVERWMVYPVVLWLVAFGSYVAASHPADAPELASSPAGPSSGAASRPKELVTSSQ
jgi:hypothetical protein